VRDLLAHRDPGEITVQQIERLRLGRHFRVGHGTKAIVARNASESNRLSETVESDEWIARMVDRPGPTVLVEGDPDRDERARIASLTVRYGGLRPGERARVELVRRPAHVELDTGPASERSMRAWRIGVVPGGDSSGIDADRVL
jgi:hypothetical protein